MNSLAFPNSEARVTPSYVTTTGAVNCLITKAADPKHWHCVEWVAWSIDGAPADGTTLNIYYGASTFQFRLHIVSSGDGFHRLRGQHAGPKGQSVTVELLGSVGRVQKLSAGIR